MSDFLIGQTVTLRATFTDIAGVLVDPTTVDLTVEAPDGSQSSPVPTNPSVGVYEHELTLDQAGWWSYRFEGSTTEGAAVCEGSVCARESALAVLSS